MKYTKDVSVIIVNWNTKDLLIQCIKSIKDFTSTVSLEIIVVDNASEDGSQEALTNKFHDVILIQNKENLGFAKANNIGIRKSKGKYLCLVNSDVEIKKDCIDKLYQFMEEHVGVGMVGPKVFLPNGELQRSFKRLPTLWTTFCEAFLLHHFFPNIKILDSSENAFIDHNKISNVDMLIGAFWLVRTLSLKDVGLLDETFYFYGEDVDWCRRFKQNNWKVVYAPISEIVHYTGMSTAASPIKYYVQLYLAKMHYGRKYYSKSKANMLRLILILHQLNRLILNAIISKSTKVKKSSVDHRVKCNMASIKKLSRLK